MPFKKLTFKPGVDKNLTPTLNEGGWSDASLVRFRGGLPQKWAGWQNVFITLLAGIARAMIAWSQLNGTQNIGVGSSKKYYVGQGGALFDITPLDLTQGLMANNPLATTNTSSTVTVTDVAHGRAVNDLMEFTGALLFNNVTISGTYRIITVVDVDHYTITAGTVANATSSGGGSGIWVARYRDGILPNNPLTTVNLSNVVTIHHVTHGRSAGDYVELSGFGVLNGVTLTPGGGQTEYVVNTVTDPDNYTVIAPQSANASSSGGGAACAFQYLVPIGSDSAIFGAGWGAGLWGISTWGTPRSTTIQTNSPRIWTHDNWGEDLIAAIRDGKVYNWVAANGTSVRMKAFPYAPLSCKTVMIGQPERHVVTLGSETGGILDPMLIRWSDVENYKSSTASWVASATNSAGSFRLSLGSKIIHGRKTSNGHVVLTDVAAYFMQFIGLPFVYGFTPQGEGAGLLGPNAITDVSGTPYWWGPGGFFAYRGSVQKLDCPFYAELFGTGANSLNQAQAEKVFAGINSSENEVIFFYPSAGGSGECDRYVAVNTVEASWYGGVLPRTAWIDRSIFPSPQASAPNGKIYQHEVGVDDDGGAMTVYIESGFIDLADGQEIILLDRIIPDFMGHGGAGTPFAGSIMLTLTGRLYPNGGVDWVKTKTITAADRYIRLPMRARQVRIKISSSLVGDWWRLGAMRINPRDDGHG